MTALMNAVISGNLPILCLLLINGADDQILKVRKALLIKVVDFFQTFCFFFQEGKTVHDLSTDKEISAILELVRVDISFHSFPRNVFWLVSNG